MYFRNAETEIRSLVTAAQLSAAALLDAGAGMGGRLKVHDGFDDAEGAVRLFAGYGDSPIWVPGGPMPYPDANLSVELSSDLVAWEADYYAGGASERGEHPAGHTARGRELAERLSAELGWHFSVSVDSQDQGEQVLIRSSRPAANPKAEQAFAARFAEEAAEAERLRHENLEAYAPNSKQVFAGRGRKKRR